MQPIIPRYLKPFKTVLSLAFLVGLIAVAAITLYLIIIPIQSDGGRLPLLMILDDGFRLAVDLQATTIGDYVVYSLLLLVTLSVGLFFLYSLGKTITIVDKKEGFAQGLSQGVAAMAFSLFAIGYLRQALLYVGLRNLPPDLHQLVSFTFRIVPEQVIYALSLLVLSRLFCYALLLQTEYEQTV
jgi:hypothetical protein